MIEIRVLYIVFLIFGLTHLGNAQNVLKHFNVDNGLLSSESYQVVQDYKGYVWIATDEGVSRYDGYEFKHFSTENGLPESTTLELYEDYKNRMWFILSTNELAYIEKDTLHIYPYNDSIKKYNPESNYPIKKSFYVDSADNVYLGVYYKDLLKITSTGQTRFLSPGYDSVQIIHRVDDKYLFTGRYKKTGVELQIKASFLNDRLYKFKSTAHKSRTILEEYNGNLYVTDYRKVFVFDEKGGVKTINLEHDIVWISKDKHNNLWFGLLHGGAIAFTDSTLTTKKYHILPNMTVTSVLEDTEGSYWFSTLYNGVYMYSPLSFRNLGQPEGVDQLPVTQIEAHNRIVYFAGKDSDLYEYKDFEIDRIDLKLKETPSLCEFLGFNGDSLFVSNTMNGVRLVFMEKVVRLNISAAMNSIHFMKNIIVLFNGKHVYHYNGNRITKIFRNNNYTNVNDAVHINDSIIWIVTNIGLKQVNFFTLKASDFENPVLNSQSNSIVKDKKGVVWLSTNRDGLISILNDSVKVFYPEILKGRTIKKLYDLDSLLIAGTNDGLLKFRKNRDSIIDHKSMRYSIGNGLINNNINDLTYLNGNVYAATTEGVAIVPIHKQLLRSPLFITNVSVNGRDTILQNSYNFSYHENDIKFEFVSLNYQRENPITYTYKLVGYDKKWRQTQDRSTTYSALQPGEYTFMLKSINAAGIESQSDYSIKILINQAFYNTIWFRAISILTFLLIVAGIFLIVLKVKLREASKRHIVEQELNRSRQQALSAQMNPHFIYNSLNSVQSYILKNERVKASEYLSKLGRLMRNILNNSQNQTITLREEFDALEKYMEMEQLRFKDVFTYKLNVCNKIDLDIIHVPPLIIQPFVENAIHHGLRLRKEGGELLVDASIIDNALQILIQDNGVGIENAKQYNSKTRKNHKSFGTEITNKRLKLLEEINKEKVELTITHNNPEAEFPGTKVILRIGLS